MEQIPLIFETDGSQYTDAELALLTPDDIWAIVDQSLLERLKEDPRIERKRSIHGGELGEYYSMWANTTPFGGIMVIGQENKGAFAGFIARRSSAIPTHVTSFQFRRSKG
jgi:ATP-dependent DNA helicase RecG